MLKGKIFVALFGLPFLAVGIWAAWSIGSNLLDWIDMKRWEPVQAHIISGGYESHSGDDATTYGAFAHYTYTFNGQTYTGDRAAIAGGSDNVGDFQQELGAKLQAAQGRDMEIYVNPDAPDQSIVNRDIRWAMIGFKAIFLVAFGGFGALAFFGALFANMREKDLSLPEYREKPWLANDAWQGGGIGANSKNAMYFAWFFTVMWNAISAPLPFIIYDEILKKENYVGLIGLLFPIIGIGLLVWSIRRTLEWKRFGPAPVTLDPFPGSIGGNVGGTIEFNLPYNPASQFVATLRCLRNEKRRRNSDSGNDEVTVWQDVRVAYTESGLYGTRVIFRFDVPEGLEQSDATKAAPDYYIWRLNLRAEIAGADVDRDYEIPVYPTKQKSAQISGRAVEASERATIEMDDMAAKAKIRFRPGIQGDEIFYPMGRNIVPGLVGMVAGLAFLLPGVFLVWHKNMPFWGGLMSVIGALIFFSSLYMPVNSLAVGKDATGALVATRRIFGIPVKRTSASLEEISSVSYGSSFSTSSSRGVERQYTITAALPLGKKLVLGEGFCGEGEARAAVAIIREKLGLPK